LPAMRRSAMPSGARATMLGRKHQTLAHGRREKEAPEAMAADRHELTIVRGVLREVIGMRAWPYGLAAAATPRTCVYP
jgi:hypothetical protein